MDTTRQSRPQWRRSARSGSNGNCVEIAVTGAIIAVRDSRDPRGPQLAFTPERWKAFTTAVKADYR
jgi:hypothetical protein